ncbi:MAG: hypothetical protein ACLP19_27140 [Xanthobacteraceae bacterium]
MTRKPTEIVPTSLRIRESLRRRVEQAAAQRGVSFNYELTSRVQDTFDREAQRTLEDVAVTFSQLEARAAAREHALDLQGDLIRAAEALVAANDQQDSKAITAATAQVKGVLKLIDQEAALAQRRARTT